MKLIHCADLHVGAPIRSLPAEISNEKKSACRNSFKRMVEYADKNDVSVILMAGDIFDADSPKQKTDVDYFYDVIRTNPQIDFLYLRGNHDSSGERTDLSNLKCFSQIWSRYDYGNISVYGLELSNENSDTVYSTLNTERSRKNIVMLHGQIGDEINIPALRNKNIDYLALGHVHSYSSGTIDSRGSYAYSGCLEGRGFDETGEKGFIVVDTDGATVTHRFIPFSEDPIYEESVDISEINSSIIAAQKLQNEIYLKKNGIYRINLTGETDIDTDSQAIADDLERTFSAYCKYITVKARTSVRIDYSSYENDLSLKGEFIRSVKNDPTLGENEKNQVIAYGLRALLGKPIE